MHLYGQKFRKIYFKRNQIQISGQIFFRCFLIIFSYVRNNIIQFSLFLLSTFILPIIAYTYLIDRYKYNFTVDIYDPVFKYNPYKITSWYNSTHLVRTQNLLCDTRITRLWSPAYNIFKLDRLVLRQESVNYLFMATGVWKPKINMYRPYWYQIDHIPLNNVGIALLYFYRIWYWLLIYKYVVCVCVCVCVKTLYVWRMIGYIKIILN